MSFWFGSNNVLSNGVQRGVWNREENGRKVPGNHKTTGSTRKPETIAEIAGKITMCIRNFNAEKSTWDYPVELDRYIGELYALGGQLRPEQRLKIVALTYSKDENKAKLAHELLKKYNLSVNRAAVPESTVEAPPRPLEARRPEDTPTRPPEEVKRRRVHADAAENRLTTSTSTTEAPTTQSSPVEENIEVDPVEPLVTPTTTTGDMAQAVPSGGSTPEGFGGSQIIQSFEPRHFKDSSDNADVVIFGGSRIMYTWAYDMYPHNDAANSEMDFFPVGHQVPWEVIPFYCTPQEYASLDWNRKNIKVARVKCRVTPLAKESQFSTQQDTVTAVSNEHLVLVKHAVGLNHKLPLVTMRYVGGNTSTSTMQINSSAVPDWGKIVDKFWGVLPAWVSGTNPISGGAAGSQPALPCSFLQYRELETIGGLLVDKYDKTTKSNNARNFGFPLVDRYVKRQILASVLGKPIVDVEHHVKNGWISYIPNVNYSKQYGSSTQHKRWGQHFVVRKGQQTIGSSNKDTFWDQTDDTFSRNINVGETTRNATGRYLMTVEKTRMINGQSGTDNDGYIHAMPSIVIGMCPIKPISVSSTLITPVQARCMWQIDYEIEFRQYSHHEFLYPTNYAADGSTVLPPNVYWSSKPPVMNDPMNWGTSKDYIPGREEGAVNSIYQQYFSVPQQNNIDEALATTVAGANYVDPCTTAYNPTE